ncbi:dCTP deaminase [Candidatus Daviesbacteria bacterium]|nr:dCTP deaminase [Candidatus Daviesbacteria bacterium]
MPTKKRGRKILAKEIPLQVSPQPNKSSSAQQLLKQMIKDAFLEYKEDQTTQSRDAYSFVGTLPDWAIKQHIKDGVIKIDPLPQGWEEKVDEVTIDFHLGNKLRVFTLEGLNTIDTRFTTKEEMESMMRIVELKGGQPFILTENDFIIATTKERLSLPNDIVGHLHGKSSLARLGIVVHSTAARFDPGWDGCPVLEFGTFLKGKKIVIYEGSPICAFSFERLAHPVDRSHSQNPRSYGGSVNPEVSHISLYASTTKNGLKKKSNS